MALPLHKSAILELEEKIDTECFVSIIAANLTQVEAWVLFNRYGVETGHERTQLDLAKEWGVSISRVHDVEQSALKKCRHTVYRNRLGYPAILEAA